MTLLPVAAKIYRGIVGTWLGFWGLVLVGAVVGQVLPLAPDNLVSALAFVPIFWVAVLLVPGLLLALPLARKRYCLGGLMLLAASYLAFGDVYPLRFVSHSVPTISNGTIKVVAANLQFYLHGIENVADHLRRLDGDVYLLSENELTPEKEARLRLALPDYHLYLGRYQSCALITKEPFVWYQEVELPSHQASLGGYDNTPERIVNKPKRAFMHGILERAGQRIHFLSIRFIAGRSGKPGPFHQLRWGRYLLRTQVAEARFFADYVRKLDGPVIFGGDLNAPPRSKTIAIVNELGTDAAAAVNGLPFNTFRTQNTVPLIRLDYLFGSQGAVPMTLERSAQIFSDHYALVGQFAITPAELTPERIRQARGPKD